MEFETTTLQDVQLIKPRVFSDNRGFFLESYSQPRFIEAGIVDPFIQDNHSRSTQRGVIRGLHFQVPPMSQSKLVRVTRGSVYDVILDLRRASPTFGKWEGFELSERNFYILYVPKGFAHGFCTLEPDTEVQYKVDVVYSPAHETGIRWNDPDLAIGWPVSGPVLSGKDSILPPFSEFISPF
jgi:dTDP-4-dehydrorhamnose 3,5-epimerase